MVRNKNISPFAVAESYKHVSQEKDEEIKAIQRFNKNTDNKTMDILDKKILAQIEKQLSERFKDARTFELRNQNADAPPSDFANQISTDFIIKASQFDLDQITASTV